MERSINRDLISHVNNVLDDCYVLLKSGGEKNRELINSIITEALALREELIKRFRKTHKDFIPEHFKNCLNCRILELYGRLNGV